VEPLGSDTLVHFAIGGDVLTARMPPSIHAHAGETLKLGIDPARVHLFDAVSECALA
jgi:multiple sugar transport system ATP-binding protein